MKIQHYDFHIEGLRRKFKRKISHYLNANVTVIGAVKTEELSGLMFCLCVVIDKLIKFGKHSNCVSAWGDDADTKYNVFRKTAEIFHLNYQMKVLLLIFKTKRYLFISYSIYEVVSKSVK